MNKIRCAIYTRKSSEEGLEQEFNSLDAQREACEAYILSQKHEGWVLLKEHYDDGGLSGGNMDRPALQNLLDAVDDGLVDQIIVYKVDRLTRSLPDFSRLIERLDKAKASFVSVTQSFNTATSMGRLTLNVLLSFAQFEREVTAERIRDKIAASKKKGMWMGGPIPLGYDVKDRMLTARKDELAIVRQIYDRYLTCQTVRATQLEADRLGLRSRRWITKAGRERGGLPFTRGHLYRILSNPIFAGMVHHKGATYEGQHEAIVSPDIWQQVQAQLTTGETRSSTIGKFVGHEEITGAAAGRGFSEDKAGLQVPTLAPSPAKSKRNYRTDPSPLFGKVFDETGDRLTPSHANKKGRRYRYYISNRLIVSSGERKAGSDDGTGGEKPIGGWRLPAQILEQAVASALVEWLGGDTRSAILIADAPADKQMRVHKEIAELLEELSKSDQPIVQLVPFIGRVDLNPGKMTIYLDGLQVAHAFGCDPDRIAPEALRIMVPFDQRKRGVETKLLLGQSAVQIDTMLIRNLAQARLWYAELKTGSSLASIAKANSTSVSLITRILPLAFLSPLIVEAICTGQQPPEITSRQLREIDIPNNWNEQLKLFDIG